MKLNSLFSKHAVLQSDAPIPVWGRTIPGLRVRARLGELRAETLASDTGAFRLYLPPSKPGGPYNLTVEAEDPSERVVVEDVLLGEVWLASGQSNMARTLAMADPFPDPDDDSELRMFSVKPNAGAGRAEDAEGSWQPAILDSSREFSAVAYHFARALRKALGVPLGMINASWGSTRIEAWMSREELLRHPRARREVLDYERRLASPEYWRERYGEFGGGVNPCDEIQPEYPRDPGNKGEKLGWAMPEFDDSSWRIVEAPGYWSNMGDPNNGSYWYRRKVAVPERWRGRDLLLCLGGADKHDASYVNGTLVGATGKDTETEHCDSPRKYKVSANLVESGEALIAVRIFSFVYGGGFSGPARAMRLRPADGSDPDGIRLDGEWLACREHDLGLVVPQPVPYGPGNRNSPYILYERMIAPLAPYAIRGGVWYQGEGNTGTAHDYARLQTSLAESWKRTWGLPSFPFGIVQLAAYGKPSNFDRNSAMSLLREAQTEAAEHPEIGMACTIDIGDEVDIHPGNKHDVGKRLGHWALDEVYGLAGYGRGPRYTGYRLEPGAIRALFDTGGKGLEAKGGEPATLVVAGADGEFHPATGVIEGNSILASSAEVAEPVALRYAWADFPRGCNLYDGSGMPVPPFRTDTLR